MTATAKPRLAPGEERFANSRPARRPQTPQPTPRSLAPTSLDDAELRFYRRYGRELIAALLGTDVAVPETIAEWYTLAEAVRDVLAAREQARGKVTRR